MSGASRDPMIAVRRPVPKGSALVPMAEPATTPTPRRSAAARGCRWLVALVIVAAVAVVPVSVHATGDGLALGRDCAQAAPGSLRVGVVVDFGILASEQGAPSRVAATCASVDAGANGF